MCCAAGYCPVTAGGCTCARGQEDGADALDGMTLLINNFNGDQALIMAEMHQEIQLLIGLFILAVPAREGGRVMRTLPIKAGALLMG